MIGRYEVTLISCPPPVGRSSRDEHSEPDSVIVLGEKKPQNNILYSNIYIYHHILFNGKCFDIRGNCWLQKTQTLLWYGSDSSMCCAWLLSEEGTREMTNLIHLLYTSSWAWCRLVILMSTQRCCQGLLYHVLGVN